MFSIHHTIERLQQRNEKSYYLAFLRVAVSLWFLHELLSRISLYDILYNNNGIFKMPSSAVFALLRINGTVAKEYSMLVIILCFILLVLNIFGIGRNVTSILLLLSFGFLYNINKDFTNSGDKMSMVVLFYLSFANTFSHFTLFKPKPQSPAKERLCNLLSNLAAYSIIINLCLAYFMAGLGKLLNSYWQNGTAMYYFLNDDRYSIFAAGGKHVSVAPVTGYVLNYGIILLEILFPFGIYFKKTRTPLLIVCLLMHIFIYSFLMIYALTTIFVLQYGIFYSNEEVKAFLQKIKYRWGKLFSFAKHQQ
ncbi:MAG: HTTM domain-containing protein [Ferruginibacter sp.]